MPKEIQGIFDSIGGFFGSPAVQLGLRAAALYIAVLWLAAAYWAFRDMQLRTANPLLPYFAASLIILFTPILFPFGVLAYRIVRPQEKVGEVYERTLAEEALLAEVESVHGCPTCGRRVNDEWIVCPTCRTRLNRVCPNCSRLVGLDWALCAWCGREFGPTPVAVEPSAYAPRPVRGTRAARVLTAPAEPIGESSLVRTPAPVAAVAEAPGPAAEPPTPPTAPARRESTMRRPASDGIDA